MIKANFKRVDGNLISVKVSGHSGYAEEGSDIVCSAVTAMVGCIGDGICEIMNINADVISERGHVTIDLTNVSNEEIKKSQDMMESLKLGLENIMNMYNGNYIKVIEQ